MIDVELIWRLRSRLSAEDRRRVRKLVDSCAGPFGSICGARTDDPLIALTFDDGPDPSVTPRLLDLLDARSARGTFFVLAEKAVQQPQLVRRMIAEGHEVGLHFDRHERLTLLSTREARDRIVASRDSLRDITGGLIRFFRPPFGAQSVATYLIARACGLDVVVWGPYGEDWVERSPEDVANRSLRDLAAGDILLLHDGLEVPPGQPVPTFDRIRAFALVLDGLAARGLSVVTVGELISEGTARRTAWFRP